MTKHNYEKSRSKRSYKRSLLPKEREVNILESQLVEKEVIEVEDKEIIEISDDTSDEGSKKKRFVEIIIVK
jgi:hypothetical protein